MRGRWFVAVLAGMSLLVGSTAAWAGDPVAGAGSTFAQKMIVQWSNDVAGKGIQVTYTGSGSGDGRAKLIAGEVDFAGSDGPAKSEEVDKLDARYGGFVHVPVTSGGIAVVYNVAEFADLKLTGSTLAKIFSGAITNWKDPAIAADNGAPGPDLPIKVFVRSDKSGSSGVFSGYLDAAGEGNWKGKTTEQFPVPANGEGREGGDGIAQGIIETKGGVGYVDHGKAASKQLDEVRVKNAAGEVRGPEVGAVRAAIDEAKINDDGTLTVTYTPSSPDAYPISTVTYVIATAKVPQKKQETLVAFLTYGLSQAGQDKAPANGYAPLSEKMQKHGMAQVEKIRPT
jgi:phosphate transport system substrate-binding protein